MEGPLLKNRYCSENLYKKQKETISKINSEKKSNTQNYPPKTVQSNQRVVKFSPDNNQWVYTTFSTLLNKKTKEESPLIVNDTWSESNAKASNGIELRNLIFQTEETFNYYITYNKIKANVILKNDSSFWIFLHSQNSFSERTATIHFSKEEFSQRIFISFGIFYNKDTELLYKELNKEMLILSFDKDKSQNSSYRRDDAVQLSILVEDNGSNCIKVETTLNESSKANVQTANFFVPVREEKCRVMIAGSGDQCKVMKFYIEKKYQEQYAKYDSTRSKEEPIECCIII